jgi:tRNA (guanine37-N1)-methyltransferase
MRIDILTLFPDAVDAMMQKSILGRAQKKGYISIKTHYIRDYTTNPQNQVDDYTYGGGRGAVMQADPLFRCRQAVLDEIGAPAHTVFLSPCGKTFTQEDAKRLSKLENLILVCGHYEGVDQRVIDRITDEELSIGDYVLTGGELPAMVLTDCIARMCPGVLSDDVCFEEESIYGGLLEYPQYTRPEVWEGESVPPILLTGHHANIKKWRYEQSLEITKERRPDLYEEYCKNNK